MITLFILTPEYIFSIIAGAYFILHLYLLSGLKKSVNANSDNKNNVNSISVIVAGRNESNNITDCINSIKQSHVSDKQVEYIFVNDNSDDNTFELMQKAVDGVPGFKVINSYPSLSSNLKGKANAIDNAISVSKGEIIISTDADCIVPHTWVNNTADHFKNETGMVCGFTFIDHKNSLFPLMQCIDWFYLLTLASSSCGLNKIMSCIGNNISFTKEAYMDVGGYSSIKFSVTEDLALMRKINASGKFKIIFPLDKNCLVKTKPCKNLNELFSQKRRWFRGGIGINILGYMTGVCLYSVNILLLFGLFFIDLPLYLLLVTVKIFSEILLLRNTFRIFNVRYLYKYYLLFTVYFAMYGLLLPLTFVFRSRIKWKNRKF